MKTTVSVNGVRVNVGCGHTPTGGWLNLDNSPAVRLARAPLIGRALVGLMSGPSRDLAMIALQNDVRWADARRLPMPAGSVDIYYTSHMLEHLDHRYRRVPLAVLREARRVLRPGGILRVVVPDLKVLAQRYASGECCADVFLEDSCLTAPSPSTLTDRLKAALIGPRHHQWMFDEATLTRLIDEAGFSDIRRLEPGESTIPDPGNLELAERSVGGSLYIEAVRPAPGED